MLEPILGTGDSERALIFILARDDGYARQIAAFFDVPLRGIQRQLARLERGGVLISRKLGRTLLYSFSPRYPFLKELQALLTRALDFYPEDLRQKLIMQRRRPRKSAKPL